MGARNFSKLYKMISAKYMLGITAEHSRADGLFKIINWYMGPVIHREEQLPNSMVVVKRFHYKSLDGDNTKMHFIRGTGMKEPDRSKMITNLTKIKKRTRFIFRIIIALFDMGKNILFLTGRLDHVNRLFEMLESDETIRGSVGMYTGEMVQKDRDKSATKQIILATYDMAQEGLDIESLNAVILGTPKGAVKQAVGRILRKEVYEEHPMVIDIIDAIEIFEKQASRRESYFETQEYQIQDHWVTEDSDDTKSISWRDSEAIEGALREIPPVREKSEKPEPKRTRVKCIVESDDEYD